MTNYPIAKVWLDRDTRQRRDLGDLTDLKASIQSIGLINPITLTRDGQLLAGERRFTACKELGWLNIPASFVEDMTPAELKQLELDENIRRLDLPWQDRARSLAELHMLISAQEGKNWSQEQTAEKIGMSGATVSRLLRVSEHLTNERVATADTLSKAFGIVERLDARKKDLAADKYGAIVDAHLPSVVQESREVSEEMEADAPEPGTPIIKTDFLRWVETYRGPKFNLIHCDFPYGISADKHAQGAADSLGSYADSKEVFMALLGALNPEAHSFISDSTHLIFWFSMNYYDEVRDELESMGWRVNPHPLIWHKTDNTGIIPDPRRMPRQIYETAFLCSRGDRFLVQPKANCIGAPVTKQWHMSEKPVGVLQHFLSMVCDDTSSLLDPTCGSGNSLIAGNRLGAKSITGIEINPEFYDNACENWRKNSGA